jgi:hypothetical protein
LCGAALPTKLFANLPHHGYTSRRFLCIIFIFLAVTQMSKILKFLGLGKPNKKKLTVNTKIVTLIHLKFSSCTQTAPTTPPQSKKGDAEDKAEDTSTKRIVFKDMSNGGRQSATVTKPEVQFPLASNRPVE